MTLECMGRQACGHNLGVSRSNETGISNQPAHSLRRETEVRKGWGGNGARVLGVGGCKKRHLAIRRGGNCSPIQGKKGRKIPMKGQTFRVLLETNSGGEEISVVSSHTLRV